MPETANPPMLKMSLSPSEGTPKAPVSPKRRALTTELDPHAEDLGEQLAASCKRLEEGLAAMGEAVEQLAAKPGPNVVLTMDGPEPAWVKELRDKYNSAVECRAKVCVVSRGAIANVLTLIDLARHRR